MDRLGSLSGNGRVSIAGEEIGEVEYSITVWRSGRGSKSASGRIVGDFSALNQIFEANDNATLELESDGGSISFIIRTLNSDGAEIVVSGPVPGF